MGIYRVMTREYSGREIQIGKIQIMKNLKFIISDYTSGKLVNES